MSPAFYLDEDSMATALVKGLRSRHVAVVTAREAGLIERPDDEHLDYAMQEGMVLYSFNAADFFRIHTERLNRGQSHAGMVIAEQQRHSIGDQVRGLLQIAMQRSAADMQDRLEFLSNWI